MTIEVFISSTSDDLKDHCRPIAIGAVNRHAPRAHAVAMEYWREEHVNPVLMCKEKVHGSTHYVGIFAYRRGWVPKYPEIAGRSITEAEYDWAGEFGLPRFILMPDATSKYAYDLYAMAAGQSREDKEAQEAFRARVKESVVRFFTDPIKLDEHLSELVTRWVDSGGAGIADHVETLSASKPPVRFGDDNDPPTARTASFNVGRAIQVGQFESVIGFARRRATVSGTCFLIQGADDYGHEELITNLRSGLDHSHEQICVPVGLNLPTSRVTGIVKKIASWVHGGSADVDTVAGLADLLRNRKLNSHEVVIEIRAVHKFEGGLRGFIESFWQPLIASLGDKCVYKLLVFLTTNEAGANGCDHLLLRPDANKGSKGLFALDQAVALEPLTPFTLEEISDWLSENFPAKSEDEIDALAEDIMIETKGIPYKVYKNLRDIEEAHF